MSSIRAHTQKQQYRSPFGPQQVKQGGHFGSFSYKSLGRLGITLGAFGGVAGFAALFFAEGVPRVRRDVLQKIPIIGSYWIREIPPSDNPF